MVVTELAENVRNTMDSLHRLQMSILNNPNISKTDIGDVFPELRRQLHDQWEALIIYLQRCYAFGADVVTLKGMVLSDDEDTASFFNDMMASSEEVERLSEELTRQDISKPFSGARELHKSGMRINVCAAGGTIKMHNLIAPKANDAPRPKAALKVRDTHLQAFINECLSAAYPNGDESLTRLDNALGGIQSNLTSTYQFWVSTSEKCRSYTPQSGSHKLTMGQADQIVADWDRYQTAVKQAVASIRTTNAAILVDAVGVQSTNSNDVAAKSLPKEIEVKHAPFGLKMLRGLWPFYSPKT